MTVLTSFVDLLYPPECAGCREITNAAHGLCPTCWGKTAFITGSKCDCCGIPVAAALPGQDIRCEGCASHPPAWDQGRAAVLYEGVAREIILRFKHRDRLDLAPVLTRWLIRAGGDLIEGADIIAPVPLHWTRLLRRRANQAAELVRRPEFQRHARVLPDLVTRRQATATLRGKTRAERHQILRATMVLTPRHRQAVQNKTVLLVDDVMTTGATLSATAEACRSAGAARVNVLVIARVAREGFATI